MYNILCSCDFVILLPDITFYFLNFMILWIHMVRVGH